MKENTNTPEQNKKIKLAKSTASDFQTGHLEGPMGYKFQTRAFLEILFLYKNSVDVANPDILGKNNKNTFVLTAKKSVRKVKEQVRLDIKDLLNFTVPGAGSLARFVVKGANRKVLKDNTFADDLDEVVDNAVDFGSGFLKVWKGKDGKLKMRSIDTFKMIFNQYDFTAGAKIEKMRKTFKWIIENEKYDADARELIRTRHPLEEDQAKDTVFYQMVNDKKDSTQTIDVIHVEEEVVLYEYEGKAQVDYFKFDAEKRSGFPDALGIGFYENVFNLIVKTKVNQERMDKVMEIAATLPFQKKMDNKRDAYAGKEVHKMKTGGVLGYKENPIEPMDTGGIKQAQMIAAELDKMGQQTAEDIGVNDPLAGKTLPSGTSGVLGNLLAENASSVLKEVQKHYSTFLAIVYDKRITPYILQVFDAKDNLEKYLDANDIKMVKTQVIGYLVSLKEVDAAIREEEFDEAIAHEEVKQELKGKDFIPGALLDNLREEVGSIEVFITGQNVSKATTVAFIREMRMTYAKNPELFKDPTYISMLKKEAEFEVGISGVEIDNLLKDLQ